MNKYLVTSLALFTLWSCDNELDIIADKKDITIVYGLLDAHNDSNYIRVQRGYLGTEPASNSFNNVDSLYYDTADIEVLIRQFDPVTDEFENERALVYDNSVPLNSGSFTTDGHYLYKVPEDYNLFSIKNYEVAVVRKDGSEAAARTGLLGRLDLNIPREILFARVFDGRIEFDMGSNGTAKVNAYQVFIEFKYRELNRTTLDSAYKTAVIKPALIETRNENAKIFLPSRDFFNSVANQIEEDPNILRFFEGIKITVWAAAEDLVTYYELNEPSSGINQNRPVFEQVTNGSGIISSRTKTTLDSIRLEPNRFFPDLINSDATCGLQFVTFIGTTRDTCFCVNGDQICL
jgi:hypothetical protein